MNADAHHSVGRWARPVSLAALCIAADLIVAGSVRADEPLDPQGPSPGPAAAAPRPMLPLDGPSSGATADDSGSSSRSSEVVRNVDASTRADEPGTLARVTISPYAWLTSQSGDLTVSGITIDADVSFAELVDKSDTLFALAGAVDVEYGRLVFQFSGLYSRVKFEESRGVFRNGTVRSDVTQTLEWYELFGGYRLLDTPLRQDESPSGRMTLDGFVGGRLTAIDVSATLSGSTTVTLPDGEVLERGTTRERGRSEEWLEPFVGARLGVDLNDRWSLSLRGDVGGFGISGATFAWSTTALVGYRWKMDGWTLAAFGGFRMLGQDYGSGDFAWDVISYGPLLGAQFSFSF